MTSGYQVVQSLFVGTYVEVTRCRHTESGQMVIVKTLRHGTTLDDRVARLRHEFSILQALQKAGISGVPVPVALLEVENTFSMVTQDIGGVSMATLRSGNEDGLRLPTILSVAVQIAHSLIQVHDLSIVHKDIKPRNVVYNSETGEAQLIDFGLAMQIGRGTSIVRAGSADGTLTHMAPEQTGRVSAPIDRRTDLFGLGATLYDLLTGRPPVLPQEVATMVHEIITQMPPNIDRLAPDVPPALTQLVTRLLDRDPRARYKSAYGLHEDLLRCQRALDATGTIEPFVLGERDTSDTLEMPRTLLGQEDALALLQQISAEPPGQQVRLVVVSGDTGAGKSSLIGALRDRLENTPHVMFAVAKGDNSGEGLGLEGLADALGQLVRRILKEPSDRFDVWRRRLQEAAGSIGGVLIGMVPAIQSIIGVQPTLADLGPTEAANRLLVVLRRTFLAVARHEQLVLCFDDAHRADPITLRLLQELAEPHPEPVSFSLILAADAAALSQASPFTEWLNRHTPTPRSVLVRALSSAEIATWLELAMGLKPGDADVLSDITLKKTAGNPQALRLFALDLWQSQVIRFDPRRGRMTWDLAKVARAAVSANVADSLLARLGRLSPASLRILGHAACVGLQFNEAAVAAAVGPQEADAVEPALMAAAEEGLVVPFDEHGNGRFTHEVVRASVAKTLDAELTRYVYGRLTRYLFARKPDQPDAGWTIMVADYLNQAEPQIVADLGRSAFDINEEAALLFTTRLNFAKGLIYADEAARLLKPLGLSLDTAHRDIIRIVSLQTSCRLGLNDPAGAEAVIQQHLRDATTAHGRARISVAYGMFLWHVGRYDDAIRVMLVSLEEQGERVPSHPSSLAVLWQHFRFSWEMIRRGLAARDLAELPRMTDHKAFTKQYVMRSVLLPAGAVRPRLTVWMALRIARHFVEWGPDPDGAAALTTFVYKTASRGDHRGARTWTNVMSSLVRDAGISSIPAYVDFYAAILVDCREQHPLTMIERYTSLQQRLFEAGDYGSAGLAVFWNIYSALLFSLGAATKLVADAQSFPPIRANGDLARELECLNVLLRLFQGFKVSVAEREMMYNRDRDRLQPLLAHVAGLHLLLFHLVTRNFNAAREMLHQRANDKRNFVSPPFFFMYEGFFCCMVATEIALESGWYPELKRIVDFELPLLKVMCRSPEVRGGCHLTLVRAQFAMVGGRSDEAQSLYDKACQEAREGHEVPGGALALEYAARFQLRRGRRALGLELLRQASSMYDVWGLGPKSSELRREVAALLSEATLPHQRAVAGDEDTNDAFRAIQSLIEVNQQLSGVYDENTILQRVSAFVAGWVGDGRVMVLAYHSGQRHIVADTSPNSALPAFLQNHPPRQTLWTVGNVLGEPLTKDDPYFSDWRAGICLFVPIIFHGEVRAGIYCDNRDALAMSIALVNNLDLVAGQTAVALANAAVFNQLEQEVESRTSEYRAAQADLDRLQFNDAEIQMASGFAHEMRTAVASARFALAAITRLDDNDLVPVCDEVNAVLERGLKAIDEEDGAAIHQVLPQFKDMLAYLDSLIANVNEGISRATSVTAQVLEYANAGQIVVGDHRVAIASMLEELVSGVATDLEANGIGLEITGDASAELSMREEHAFAVMRNLLANARDAVRSKGPAGEKRIVVTVAPEPHQVRVQVRDTGIGMSQETQGRIFQPFYTTKGINGTGLGLGLSRKLVRLYGGDLEFTSREGEGTVFSFTVPRVGKQ